MYICLHWNTRAVRVGVQRGYKKPMSKTEHLVWCMQAARQAASFLSTLFSQVSFCLASFLLLMWQLLVYHRTTAFFLTSDCFFILTSCCCLSLTSDCFMLFNALPARLFFFLTSATALYPLPVTAYQRLAACALGEKRLVLCKRYEAAGAAREGDFAQAWRQAGERKLKVP